MTGFIVFLAAAASIAAAPPVPDHDLAAMRGGFALPGGLDVAIAVQTDTKVDGALLLRTVYRLDQGAPRLAVYAPEAREAQKSMDVVTSGAASAPQAGITVTFDRRTGPHIAAVSSTPALTVGVGRSGEVGAAPAGAAALDLQRDGDPVSVSDGRVSLASLPNGQRVEYQGDSIEIVHLVGGAIGSVVANSASDRAIGTATTLSLDISGATAQNLGSSLMRAEALALDSTAAMMPR